MYIDIVPNRGSKPAILLRRSYRKDGRVCKETVANLSDISEDQAQIIRNVLRGKNLVKQNDADIEIVHSAAHGHIKAVLLALKRLQINKLLGVESDTDRNLKIVKALIVCDVLKLEPRHALNRNYEDTTLGQLLKLDKVEEHELHTAMDWLYERKHEVEKQLADRHLPRSDRIITCLSSCALDGILKTNFWLITDEKERPISVYAYPHIDSFDIKDFRKQAGQLLDKQDFSSFILVGDRKSINPNIINQLSEAKDMNWIDGMPTLFFSNFFEDTNLNLDTLFKVHHLVEFSDPDYPGERFIVWLNKDAKKQAEDKRKALRAFTTQSFDKIKELVKQGVLKKRYSIRRRVDDVLDESKLRACFSFTIKDNVFEYEPNQVELDARKSRDGVFGVKTSLGDNFSPVEIRYIYKNVLNSNIKKRFQTISTISPKEQPILAYSEVETNKYLFVRLLAQYVEWHITNSWQKLTKYTRHDMMTEAEDQSPKQADTRGCSKFCVSLPIT